MPLTPQQQATLDALLRRANPTPVQLQIIARLQALAGLPPSFGPNYARRLARLAEERSRREQIRREIEEQQRGPPVGPPGPEPPVLPGFYVYRRIVEFTEANRRQRTYHIVRVVSDVPLSGRLLEEAFAREVLELRRLLKYGGPASYVEPLLAGRTPPPDYAPFNPLLDYNLEVPEDLDYDMEFPPNSNSYMGGFPFTYEN